MLPPSECWPHRSRVVRSWKQWCCWPGDSRPLLNPPVATPCGTSGTQNRKLHSKASQKSTHLRPNVLPRLHEHSTHKLLQSILEIKLLSNLWKQIFIESMQMKFLLLFLHYGWWWMDELVRALDWLSLCYAAIIALPVSYPWLVPLSKALYHTCFIWGQRCKWWSRPPKLTSLVISDIKRIIYIVYMGSSDHGEWTCIVMFFKYCNDASLAMLWSLPYAKIEHIY